MVALHKIGAVAIPATHMLKLHDIDFRIKNANVKLIVTVEEDRHSRLRRSSKGTWH